MKIFLKDKKTNKIYCATARQESGYDIVIDINGIETKYENVTDFFNDYHSIMVKQLLSMILDFGIFATVILAFVMALHGNDTKTTWIGLFSMSSIVAVSRVLL